MYNTWEPCQYPPDSKGKAQVPPLAQCCIFGASALRWHGRLSAKVTKNANLGYSHDRGLS